MFSAPMGHWLRISLIATASAAVAAGGLRGAAQPPWRMLETPRFTVITQLADKPTREWAEEFNQFIEELRLVFRTERPHMLPLTVVLFARDRDFTRYKPLRPDGRGPAPVAGFFNHHGSWSVIGLAENYDAETTRELVFHEGVHWFMSTDPVTYPLWLAEGMAEVFSTFRQEGGKVRWGSDINAHVALLRSETMLPFERFLYLSPDDPLFNRSHRTGIFYAQSWVFVHYLLYGAHDGARDAIARYFDVLNSGTGPDDAFKQAFGHDYDGMARTLAKYIRTGQYGMRIRPISPADRITGSPQPAEPALVEVALARLALAADRPLVARPHAERAVQLAPQHPGGYEMLAQLLDAERDHAGARAACARAEMLGSHDASTLFLLAYLRGAEALETGMEEAQARQIANLYRRVIAAAPTMAEAYENLAGIAPALGAVEPGDLAALKQGARMFPQRGTLLLGLAVLEDRVGQRATAWALLKEARKRGLPITDAQQAHRLESSWLYDEASATIDRLAAATEFTEAIVVCDEASAKISDIHIRTALQHRRQSLLTQARLFQAQKSMHTGDYPAARRIYESILAEPASDGGLRRHVQEILRRLPAAVP